MMVVEIEAARLDLLIAIAMYMTMAPARCVELEMPPLYSPRLHPTQHGKVRIIVCGFILLMLTTFKASEVPD